MSATSSAPASANGKLWVKLYRLRAQLRRNWWVLALTIGAGLAFQGWKIYRQPQLFESVSQLNIREELNVGVDSFRSQQTPEQLVNTTLAILKSPEILGRAQARLALEVPGTASEPPEISTAVLPRTTIFNIIGQGPDPEYTQRFVDATVQEFINFRKEKRAQTVNEYSGGLDRRVEELQRELEAYRKKFQDFVKANNMAYWAEQQKQATEYLAHRKNRQAALQSELQRLTTLTPDQLLVSPPLQQPPGAGTPGPLPDGANLNQDSPTMGTDLYLLYLRRTQELAQAQARLDERSRVWKPKHPKLMALRDQVNEIQRTLELIRQQNRDSAAQRIDALRADLKIVEEEVAAWEKKVLEASSKDIEYRQLQDDVKRTEASLDKLRTSTEALGTGPRMDLFSVIQPASPPAEVPKGVAKQLIIGFLLGAAAGLGILIFKDRMDDRITSSSEMMDHFSEPILGQIPDVQSTRTKSGLPLLQPDDDRYSFAESFRSLRSSLIFMPNTGEVRTLIVTSAIPNEGKSTIASNLAITMAATGAKVIVVDADLRRGDLAELFERDGRRGLSNVLRKEVRWQEVVQATKYPSLTLLPRGPITNQSGELLLLPHIESLLEELKASYDLVLFNTAPILATDDTPTLAPHFDGTLMVIRAHFTSARMTHNALTSLYQRQVNVLGLILNCVDTDMPDYYHYHYPQYYAAR